MWLTSAWKDRKNSRSVSVSSRIHTRLIRLYSGDGIEWEILEIFTVYFMDLLQGLRCSKFYNNIFFYFFFQRANPKTTSWVGWKKRASEISDLIHVHVLDYPVSMQLVIESVRYCKKKKKGMLHASRYGYVEKVH